MLQGIPGAQIKREQTQSVQDTLMLYELRESQEARPMFDPCEDVRECAQLVWEMPVLHESRESQEGGPMFDPHKDVLFCGD